MPLFAKKSTTNDINIKKDTPNNGGAGGAGSGFGATVLLFSCLSPPISQLVLNLLRTTRSHPNTFEGTVPILNLWGEKS